MSEEDRKRYQGKLEAVATIVGLLLKDDPFDPNNAEMNTVTSMSTVIFPRILPKGQEYIPKNSSSLGLIIILRMVATEFCLANQ